MHLFVYGTLAPGESNEHLLKHIPGNWRPGIVKGEYFASGWGPAFGYPGVVLSANGEDVNGQLFSSPELAKHWEELDEFEGDGYQRVVTAVLLENGETIDAFIYELSAAGRK